MGAVMDFAENGPHFLFNSTRNLYVNQYNSLDLNMYSGRKVSMHQKGRQCDSIPKVPGIATKRVEHPKNRGILNIRGRHS